MVRCLRKKEGFTLVEAMVAMVSASILALAVGGLLVAGFRGWNLRNKEVDRQRDASLAMEAIGRHIRESDIMDIQIGGTRFSSAAASASSIAFDANPVRSQAVSIVKEGDALRLNPDGISLVRSGVQSFIAEFNANGPRVHIILQLFDPDTGSMISEGTYRTRNDNQ